MVLRNLGVGARRRREWAQAQVHFGEALDHHWHAGAINRALDDRYRLGQTLLNEALVWIELANCPDPDPDHLRRGVALLERLRDESIWPRGRCFALQNLARVQWQFNKDRDGAWLIYEEAWAAYRALVGDHQESRDIAFEEWTLRAQASIAEPEQMRALFDDAYGTFQLMRENLRHVLFRRGYADRVIEVLERGLDATEDTALAASYLGGWTAQEIADLRGLAAQVQRRFEAVDFTDLDDSVAAALDAARRARDATKPQRTPSEPAEERMSGSLEDTASFGQDVLGGAMLALHRRHERYLEEIERAPLVPEQPYAPWTVDRLRAALPEDAAVIAYVWPSAQTVPPRAFIVTRARELDVVALGAPPDFDRYTQQMTPTPDLLMQMHQHLVAPWIDRIEASSVYLVPYRALFRLPIHCARPVDSQPILMHSERFDRVLYAVSMRELTQTLEERRFGRYGDRVRVGRGLAVVDPNEDDAMHRLSAGLRRDVERLERMGKLTGLLGRGAATYRRVLDELESAAWWLHFGHGNVPSDKTYKALQAQVAGLMEDARIGAVLELADGLLEDLDILLRCGGRTLRFCLLSACISAGMEVSLGNEVAGFVRALKVRGCGPIAMAYWQIGIKKAAAVMQEVLAHVCDSDEIELFAAVRRAVGRARAAVDLPSLEPRMADSGMFGVYV
jgi:hypothetical protein